MSQKQVEAAQRKLAENPNYYREIGLRGGQKSTGYKVLSRPVIQKSMDGTVLGEFPSIRQAARATGTNFTSIHACLKGRMVQAGGYLWEPVNAIDA